MAELARIEAMGGAVAAVESELHEGAAGRIQRAAHRRHRSRRADGGRREQIHRTARRRRSPPAATAASSTVDEKAEADADREPRRPGAPARDQHHGRQPRSPSCAPPRSDGRNIMPPSIACAHAGVTTGEWGAALRRPYRRVSRAHRRRARRRHARRQQQPGRAARARGAAVSPGSAAV